MHKTTTASDDILILVQRAPTPQATSLLRKLLQLLLCASLLLNGMGAATASARVVLMTVEAAGPVATAPQPDSDCHKAAAAVAPKADMRTADAAMPASATDPHQGHDEQDCLQFCLDMCMQQCHALFGGHALTVSTRMEDAPLTPLDTGLLSLPRLPPIRPPIA